MNCVNIRMHGAMIKKKWSVGGVVQFRQMNQHLQAQIKFII